MWCKVYRGGPVVEPVRWPSAHGSPRMQPAPHQQRTASESSAPVEHLQHRIAQLEEQAEIRAREAYEAGVSEGRRAAALEIEPAMQRLAKTLEELSRCKGRLRKEAEADVVALALAVAKRILRRELSVDAEALQGVIGAALETLRLRELSRVRVHPNHDDFVRRHLSSATGATIQVLADSSLEVGDILFETTRGTVDASIDSQLREIENGFTDRLGR